LLCAPWDLCLVFILLFSCPFTSSLGHVSRRLIGLFGLYAIVTYPCTPTTSISSASSLLYPSHPCPASCSLCVYIILTFSKPHYLLICLASQSFLQPLLLAYDRLVWKKISWVMYLFHVYDEEMLEALYYCISGHVRLKVKGNHDQFSIVVTSNGNCTPSSILPFFIGTIIPVGTR